MKIEKNIEIYPDYQYIPNQSLKEYVETFLTENRKQVLKDMLKQRTKYLTVIAEHLIDEHNIHAMIRSSECFGLQDFHNIPEENVNLKKNRSVTRGAFQWTHVFNYSETTNSSLESIQHIKSLGYKVYASSSHIPGAYTPDTIPIDQPLAIIMGKEHTGIQEETLKACDGIVTIPMYGFTESFNVSVACSLIIQPIITRIRQSKVDWKLSPEAQEDIYYEWIWNSIKQPDQHYKQWLVNNSAK